MDLVNSLTTDVLSKALDGLSMRHQAIAGNLANVDTPNFKRRDVAFEGALSEAIQAQKSKGSSRSLRPASNDEGMSLLATRPGHFGIGNGTAMTVNDLNISIQEQDGLEYRRDGNSVDVETEMVQLARNTERFQAISTMESRGFKSLKNIIAGGGG